MAKVKILIVEDELLVAMNMTDLLDELGYEVLPAQTNYDEAVECLRTEKPDIALLDIQIEGEKSGIEVAHYIREHMHIPFIFLTSMADARTVDQAKILKPHAYLVKPFNQDDLYTSIELALHNFQTSRQAEPIEKAAPVRIQDAFFIKSKGLFQKVKFSEIVYVKSDHVYLEIFTNTGKCHVMRSSMVTFLDDVPQNFVRVHRSYAINIDFIDSLSLEYINLLGHQVPVGKNYSDQLMKMIQIK